MDIEVIHNKDDLFRIRFDLIHKAPDLFRPIHCGSGFLYRMDNPPGVGLDEAEHADCSIAYIFRIYLRGIPRTHRQRLPAVAKNLVRLFVHAPDRVAGVIRKLVNVQNILHVCHKVRVLLRRDAPIGIQVRPDFIALHYPSDRGTAEAFFKDGYAFLCQKRNRPTRIPLRWRGACRCYDFRLHLAGGFQACRIGIRVPCGCNCRPPGAHVRNTF